MTKYSDLLKDVNWQRKRLLIMSHKDWMCEHCGRIENVCLHVHHKKYIKGKNPWEYPDSNFLVLCESCHFDEELRKLEKKYNQIAKQLINDWLKEEYKNEIN